jgi:tetratricopeptide (TPR) repeat protein
MFGLVATSLPPGDPAMAEVLVHETQHSKLHVIEGLATLVLDATEDLCSPWRPDPRPASGVLHGAYSFAAVAELWGALAVSRNGEQRAQAAAEAAHRREQVLDAVETMRSSGRLAPLGMLFVDELERRADALRAVDHWVAPADMRRVEQALVDHRARWNERACAAPPRSRSTRRTAPAPAVAEVLARLGVGPTAPNVAGSRDIRRDPSMRRLGQLKVLEPGLFDTIASAVDGLADGAGADVVRGHVAYVRRNFEVALGHYRAALDEDPHDLDRWADLAFCLRQMGRFDDSTAILDRLDELAGAGTTSGVPS